MSPIVHKDPVTNTLSRFNLKDIFSSKVLSFKMTKRYLCKSFLFISFLFLIFLAIMNKDKDGIEYWDGSFKFYKPSLSTKIPSINTGFSSFGMQTIKITFNRLD